MVGLYVPTAKHCTALSAEEELRQRAVGSAGIASSANASVICLVSSHEVLQMLQLLWLPVRLQR